MPSAKLPAVILSDDEGATLHEWRRRRRLRTRRSIFTPARGAYCTELAARHVGRPLLGILAEFALRRDEYIEALTRADAGVT